MNIGFDFGTTNSIVSYYDRDSNALTCFAERVNAPQYIPTVISYKEDDIIIGRAAKTYEYRPDTYSCFKLRLGKFFEQPMPGKEKTTHAVAKDYINSLLMHFKNAGNEIDDIVMTIPEAWYREESNLTARENILKIYQEIKDNVGYKKIRFQSEPVAAGAYFCWKYQYMNAENSKNEPFDGNLMIIDYGGGTLDVTLLSVTKGKRIRVLDSCGYGEDLNHKGCAGVAFDEKVIEILNEEWHRDWNEAQKLNYRNNFETLLIENKETCTRILERYYSNKKAYKDRTVFEIDLGGLDIREIKCRHLDDAFNAVNQEVLIRAITKMKDSATNLNWQNFKIVLVGGYSNFHCVEATARSVFNAMQGVGATDPRFTNLLDDEESKAYAIAKGAALIANGKIMVDPVFPYEFGFIRVSTLGGEEKGKILYNPLITKGELISAYHEPRYFSEEFQIYNMGGATVFPSVYTKHGDEEPYQFDLDEDLSPYVDKDIKIGLSVDDNIIPTLYIAEPNGKVLKSAYLNEVLSQHAVRRKEE